MPKKKRYFGLLGTAGAGGIRGYTAPARCGTEAGGLQGGPPQRARGPVGGTPESLTPQDSRRRWLGAAPRPEATRRGRLSPPASGDGGTARLQTQDRQRAGRASRETGGRPADRQTE